MSELTHHNDSLHRFISMDHSFRVVVAVNTGVVQEACLRHGLTGLAAVALGRGLTAAQLMATLSKGDERVTLQVRGAGPLRGVIVDAWSDGGVRGYVTEKIQVAPPEGRIWLYKLVGRQGTVTVQRDVGLKDIYQGTGALVQGEIDEDIEGYLRTSEQIPSALGCDVILDEEGRPLASAGVLVQGMPGTKTEKGDPIREAQHALRQGLIHKWLRACVDDALTPEAPELAAAAVHGHLLKNMAVTPLTFRCPCSLDRLVRAISSVGVEELTSMIEEDHGASANCPFCGTTYHVTEEELVALRDRMIQAEG